MMAPMARKPRVEIEGGLYHVITRGNNRQMIFNSKDDYLKMLALLEHQKRKLPFRLYAYCLMPNHIHLLIERREDSISRIMQRVLTGYSQYHNRRYRKSGHVLQGRYKAILCESDQYLAELVRYIHLNPVRAKIVRKPEGYEYSGHRAYLGQEDNRLVDSDTLLRYFGGRKTRAREQYRAFVLAGMKDGHREELYQADEGRLLGSEEFVESTKHRIGEIPRGARPERSSDRAVRQPVDTQELMKAVEEATGMKPTEISGRRRSRDVVEAKEAMILVGMRNGASQAALSEALGIDGSAISRRLTAARSKAREVTAFATLVQKIEESLLRNEKTDTHVAQV